MPFCPKCKAEYDEGFTTCADCYIPLVSDPPPKEAAGNEPSYTSAMRRVFLTTTSNNLENEMLIDLLNQEGIPAFSQEKEAGNYLNIYMGYSSYGSELYVDKDDFEAAHAVVENFFANKEFPIQDSQSNLGEKPVKDKAPFRSRALLMLIWIVPAGISLVLLLIYYLTSLF